jgi:hypothetical protein
MLLLGALYLAVPSYPQTNSAKGSLGPRQNARRGFLPYEAAQMAANPE